MERKVPKYEKHKIRDNFLYISLHPFLSQSPGGTFHELCSDAIFVVCLQTFALFWLRKTAVPVEILRYSFRVLVL